MIGVRIVDYSYPLHAKRAHSNGDGKELAEVTQQPPEGMTISLLDEADIYKWHILMEGPEGSVYAVSPLPLLLRSGGPPISNDVPPSHLARADVSSYYWHSRRSIRSSRRPSTSRRRSIIPTSPMITKDPCV